MFLKSRAVPPPTSAEDPRVGHLLGLRTRDAAEAKAVILGFPSDAGVRLNGGRPGAAGGPEAIRHWLYRFTPDAENEQRSRDLLERTLDLGDLAVTGEVQQDQNRLGDVLAPLLSAGVFVVVLGGGHETSFGHFLGYAGSGQRVGILNWDAHPDVRPLADGHPHSGTPFRQALQHPSNLCAGYTVAGLLPHSVSAAHLDWLAEQQGNWIWGRDLDASRVDTLFASHGAHPLLASFDLDALDAAFAPGVSAPAAGGMTPSLWLRAARRAGASPSVRSVDVVELNPVLDRDSQTARLAARTVWEVLAGLAERG